MGQFRYRERVFVKEDAFSVLRTEQERGRSLRSVCASVELRENTHEARVGRQPDQQPGESPERQSVHGAADNRVDVAAIRQTTAYDREPLPESSERHQHQQQAEGVDVTEPVGDDRRPVGRVGEGNAEQSSSNHLPHDTKRAVNHRRNVHLYLHLPYKVISEQSLLRPFVLAASKTLTLTYMSRCSKGSPGKKTK